MGYVAEKYDRMKGEWDQLNDAEKKFVLLNPGYVDEIKDSTKKAKDWAVSWFGLGGLHNGPADAFRHCFWNALMARDMTPAKAKEFSTAHEQTAGQPAIEKQMDLHNNGVGVEIGKNHPNADDYVLATEVWYAYHRGDLRIIDPGSGSLKATP